MAGPQIRPAVFDATSKKVIETPVGYKLATDMFSVAGQLSITDDGIYYVAGEHIADRQHNFLMADNTGKLFVELSADPGNDLAVGSDGRIYFSEQQPIPDDFLSQCEGNIIILGCDGKFYLNIESLISQDEHNTLVVGDDGKLYTSVYMTYDLATGQLRLLERKSDIILSEVIILPDASVLEDAGIEVDPSGQPAGTYLYLTFRLGDGTDKTVYVDVTSLIDVYEPGNNGVRVENYEIFLKVRDADGPLKIEGTAGDTDGGLYVDYEALISQDAGNGLTTGDDGKLLAVGGVGKYVELTDAPGNYDFAYAASPVSTTEILTTGVLASPNADFSRVIHTDRHRWVTTHDTITPPIDVNNTHVLTIDASLGSEGAPVYNNKVFLLASQSPTDQMNIRINTTDVSIVGAGVVCRTGYMTIVPYANQLASVGYTDIELGPNVYWAGEPVTSINEYPEGVLIRYTAYTSFGGTVSTSRLVLEKIYPGGVSEDAYHVNLEFSAEDEELRFFIPPGCTRVEMPLASVQGDVTTFTGLTVRMSPTYSTATMTPLDIAVDGNVTLTNQAQNHVTAIVQAGWPSGATALSLDLVFYMPKQ